MSLKKKSTQAYVIILRCPVIYFIKAKKAEIGQIPGKLVRTAIYITVNHWMLIVNLPTEVVPQLENICCNLMGKDSL